MKLPFPEGRIVVGSGMSVIYPLSSGWTGETAGKTPN